jgi:nitroreductase
MLNLLKSRRSIRKFKAHKIEKEKIKRILQCALIAPSGRGLKPWEFVVVDDKKLIEKLSEAKPTGAQFSKGAPLVIVVMAEKEKSVTWIEDLAIASTIMQLEAERLGVGSCWVQLRNRMYDEKISSDQYVRELLDISEKYEVAHFIAFGYADEEKPDYTNEDMDFDKVSYNKFGTRI